jgi:DNA-binding LytR/AlgR family response regulator
MAVADPKFKIGIVEDDLIIARAISEMLVECGYDVTEPATRYSEAISMIEEEEPDLLLLDIKISGKLDGVMVAKTVNEQFGTPFIFLTGNSDTATIDKTTSLSPAAFLIKPVSQHQLYATIQIALTNSTNSRPASKRSDNNPIAWDHIFVKDNGSHHRLKLDEILMVESEENYVRIHFANGSKSLLRYTLSDFSNILDNKRFARVHRSYIVALNKIREIQTEQVTLDDGRVIPVSKSYRDEVFRLLQG